MRRFKKLHTENRETKKIQSNVDEALIPVLNKPIIDGALLQSCELRSDRLNEVAHGLNRPLLGWIIVRKNGVSDIYDLQDENNNKEKTITLRCTQDVTVDIWVF